MFVVFVVGVCVCVSVVGLAFDLQLRGLVECASRNPKP